MISLMHSTYSDCDERSEPRSWVALGRVDCHVVVVGAKFGDGAMVDVPCDAHDIVVAALSSLLSLLTSLLWALAMARMQGSTSSSGVFEEQSILWRSCGERDKRSESRRGVC